MPRPLARTLRALFYTLATLAILWLSLIEAPMWLMRLHAKHLLADFQSIYPTQSNWIDAQRLMTKWGAWGHYEGQCTSASCNYQINLSSPPSSLLPANENWFERFHLFAFAMHLGLQPAMFTVAFTVSNGVIVRTSVSLGTNFEGNLVLAQSQTRSRLTNHYQESSEPPPLGNDEQLDVHPDYKVGAPGACEECIDAGITYTPTLPHSEVVRLTSFNFSCITRFRPCEAPEDLLPAAREWRLYSANKNGPNQPGVDGPITCRTEARARARDADFILEVDTLSSTVAAVPSADPPEDGESDRLRIVRVIKGTITAQAGSEIFLMPFSGSTFYNSPEAAEHLVPGHRYFVFLNGIYNQSQSNHFESDRCGVLESTPVNLAQINIGIAQDTPEPPAIYSFP